MKLLPMVYNINEYLQYILSRILGSFNLSTKKNMCRNKMEML